MGEGGEGRGFENDPTPAEVDAYLERVGRERFSNELGILAQEPFRAAGSDAERDGWFLGRRAVMSGLLAEKIAMHVHLSVNDTKALVSAAVLTSPMRRAQYDFLKREDRSVDTLTTAEREAIDDEGSKRLLELGVDPFVVQLTEANNPRFSRRVGGGWERANFIQTLLNTQKARAQRLQKILLYVHDCVTLEIQKLPDGRKAPQTDVSDWRGRLADAKNSYQTIGKERFPDADRNDVPYFELEARVVGEAERDIQRTMKRKNPRMKVPKGSELAAFFREEIMNDVRADAASRKGS